MSEFPDFAQMARHIVEETGVSQLDEWTSGESDRVVASIAARLRVVWNLRGACDIAAIDEVAHTNETAVEAAIERLDR